MKYFLEKSAYSRSLGESQQRGVVLITVKQDGFDIRLTCQPSNSPYLNILDLDFFRAIQAKQSKERAKTVDELVNNVVKSFEEFSVIMSNHIFLSLQLCMREIMKERGSHKYKVPHIGKLRLEREDNLPTQVKCDATLVQDAQFFLN
ncbi:hypothetical protein M5689_000596 [Euphorbia peplus]|nr:hypothetical protein M5689_000596 [Euphorbia peplus]